MQDWYLTAFELIDMRSFSNLWYWIALAVAWSTASHLVIGVPFDMITRAQRSGGQAEHDMRDMVRVNVNRLLYIADTAGAWMLGIGSFLLTVLGMLGFVYGVEFAQALLLLALPMSFVVLMSIRTSRRIRDADGEGLYKMLQSHRFRVQLLGMFSIFVTAFWGMWQNLNLSTL